METRQECECVVGESSRGRADQLEARDLMVVGLAGGEELDGRRGSEGAGGRVDVDQLSEV